MLFPKYENLIGRYEKYAPIKKRPPITPVNEPTPVQETTPVAGVQTTAAASVPFSPEISGLKHSIYSLPLGTTTRERQNIYNLGQEQVAGATKTAMEQMREALGSKGFRAGESGMADSILGGIAKQGLAETSKLTREMTAEEARRRFEESITRGQFGLDLEKFGYGKETDAIQMLLSLYGMGLGNQQQRWAPYWQGMIQSYGG